MAGYHNSYRPGSPPRLLLSPVRKNRDDRVAEVHAAFNQGIADAREGKPRSKGDRLPDDSHRARIVEEYHNGYDQGERENREEDMAAAHARRNPDARPQW